MILNKEIILLEPDYVSSNRIMIQDCLMLLHHNVKLYHLYHCCKEKKIIIKKQSKPIYICLLCRSQLLGPLRQSSVKQSDSAENARENAIEKNTCQKCGMLTKYKLWFTSLSSIGMVLVLKDRGPGFKSSRCIKCLYYIFLWLNGSILESFLFLVSIMWRRTSWLLSYQEEGRLYWQRVKFTGVSAIRVFHTQIIL